MTIEPITREEWEALIRRGSRERSAESTALIAAPVGSGLKMPCRWKHFGKTKVCSGASMLLHVARRHSFIVRTRCRDGMLYVWKEAPHGLEP